MSLPNPIKTDYRVSAVIKGQMELRDLALAGKVVRVISPATVNTKSTGGNVWIRDRYVTVSYQTAKSSEGGVRHTWLNGTVNTSIADTVTATYKTASTAHNIVDGLATIRVFSTGAKSSVGGTNTLTLKQQAIAGITLSTATSVETFTT
jgi:hypothetical protein